MKKKSLIWWIILPVVLISVVCAALFLGKQPEEEPEKETTVTKTEPTVVTEPEVTEPPEQETLPPVEEDEPVILQAGHIQKHNKGKNGDGGIYFSMEANEVPADTTWKTEYRPTSKGVIKLIRDGETYEIGKTAGGMVIKYNETDYYLKLEEYLIRDYYPIRDNDIIVVEGIFRHGETFFEIEKSYMLISEGLVFYTTEYPEGMGVSVKYVGHPTSHQKGKTQDGIYFTLEENSVPYNKDWSLQYSPASEANVQLIRNGKTYNIGNKAAETIIKYNDTSYFLKMEKWIIKDFYPIRDGDIIVLSGKFANSGAATVFSISKTYIAISEGMVFFSNEYPTDINVEAVKIPIMQTHPNGFVGNGLYFKADENSLPFNTDWSLEYYPREASCVKLIRDGEEKEIGNINAAAIIKYSETNYFLKLEQWIYKEYYPFKDGDILVIEGKFVNAGLGALMEMGRTYIAISSGMAYFSSEYPTGPVGPTKVQAGAMSGHPNGWVSARDNNWGGAYFKMSANDAPFTSDWSTRYVPTDAANVKLIRDGETQNVANTAAAMIAKYSATDYYLEFWPITIKPLKAGDILIVEGNFVNADNNVVICIEKTQIKLNADGTVEFTSTAGQVLQAGHASSHPNGWNSGSNDGLYFTMANNEIPYNSDWSLEYEPASAASLKLVRDGQTFNIGQPGKGTIVKYGDTDCYLKLAAWTIGDYFPIVPGDVLILEGEYKNADNGVTFAIDRSIITVGEGYALTFTAEENVDATIKAGAMSGYDKGWDTQSNKGLYFTLADNDIPYSGDWTTLYTPVATGNIQLIRGGRTVDLAKTDREYIAKTSNNEYYLMLDKWTIGDYYPIVPGDVIVVGGNFHNPLLGVEFAIDTTYIIVGEDYALQFTTEPVVPEESNHGPMKAHTNGWTATGGLYFRMDLNDAPFDDWNVRYKPTSESNVKLIRNGVTYNVAHTGRETITKYSETNYYFEFWTLDTYKPVLAGDVMIVEGEFVNAATGGVLKIAKTTITFNADGTATFQSEGEAPEPDVPDVPEESNHGPMQSHTNGWNATGGLYFTMAANDVPYGDWNVRYKPTSESNVKLIRNGVTYNVAHTGRETITKYSETEYYYEFWTLDTYKPVLAGDVMIVEGEFVNASSGAVLNIAKTTITFNADGTATFQSENAEPEVPQEPESKTKLPMLPWSEKAWNTNSNGGFWFTMDANDIPADETWVLEYAPVTEEAMLLVRGGQTTPIAIPGRGTIVKGSESEYYLKLEWNIGDYANTITVGDVLIIEGDFTNATSGYTFTVEKTMVTIGADYALTFQSGEEEEDDSIAVGPMLELSGSTSAIIYFNLMENDIPSGVTKSDFRAVDAGVIKLIRGGQVYEIADPNAKTIVKQTSSKYRLLRNALTMELQAGDVLVVEGKFVGGNGDVVYTMNISKTYITIGEGGKVSFSTEG